eukprot:11470634-Karenia_brevis.AAC.1
MGYRTKQELLDMNGGNVKHVDSIISLKVATGMWRPHPDCPNIEDLHQYWVTLSTEAEVEDMESTLISGNASMNIDAGDGANLLGDGGMFGDSAPMIPGMNNVVGTTALAAIDGTSVTLNMHAE